MSEISKTVYLDEQRIYESEHFKGLMACGKAVLKGLADGQPKPEHWLAGYCPKTIEQAKADGEDHIQFLGTDRNDIPESVMLRDFYLMSGYMRCADCKHNPLKRTKTL